VLCERRSSCSDDDDEDDYDADDADGDDDIGGVYIMSGPRNVTVPDGGTARLHCDVDGFPDNISVDWIFDTGIVASTWSTTGTLCGLKYKYRY